METLGTMGEIFESSVLGNKGPNVCVLNALSEGPGIFWLLSIFITWFFYTRGS